MKYCKLCKKPANECTIIHKTIENSALTAGYCLNCQEWIFVGFLVFISGIGITLAGILRVISNFDFVLLLWGVGILVLATIFIPVIEFLFYRKNS